MLKGENTRREPSGRTGGVDGVPISPEWNRDLLLSTRFVYHSSSNYTLVDGSRRGPSRCIAAPITPLIGKKNSAKSEWPRGRTSNTKRPCVTHGSFL